MCKLIIKVTEEYNHTPINDMKMWLANANHVISNRSEYDFDTVMLAIRASKILPNTIELATNKAKKCSTNYRKPTKINRTRPTSVESRTVKVTIYQGGLCNPR